MDLVGLLFVLFVTHFGGAGGAEEDNGINSHQPYALNFTAIQQFPTHCATHCKDQLQYNSICIEGCGEWRRALRDGCGAVCVAREAKFREFHACQVGCSKVIEDYYFYLSGILGVPEPPSLIPSTLGHTSLDLSWEGVQGHIPHLLFTVQKKVSLRSEDWESPLIDAVNTTHVTVDGLRPYTEYQFRIGWLIAQDFPPVYSAESVGIVTLAKGLPNSPQITSIQPITNTSVSVTWLPPSQPNGPLIAYILKLQNIPDGHLILKEIPILGSQNHGGYTFSALLPNTNYSLAISALNREGEGEPKLVTFFTPQSQTSNDISKSGEPKLLIQGIREVYVQAIDLLLQPEVSVFVSTKNVTGMCAHFGKNLVFVATGDGDVVRRSLGPGNDTKVILRRDKVDMTVTFLSVDWLHDTLYLVGRKKRGDSWVIKKSDLSGARSRTVLANIGATPIDFQADPYTGYLYWVTSSGLYRMDLFPNRGSAEIVPLVEEEGLGPFTIDFTNYRILLVHKRRNTVYAVSLDGEKSDIRGNTQSPNWAEVVSIGNYDGVFYWTTGTSIVVEEYNAIQRTFYHNSYEVAKSHQPCSRLLLVHPSLQPTPAPMAPPANLQAVFSQRQARVTWNPPPQIAGLGEGSWRNWNYEVTLSNNTGHQVKVTGVNDTNLLLNNLLPNTQYSFQVVAYSESGRSPPSTSYKGFTVEETSNLTVVWASDAGRIYTTDTLGDEVRPIVFLSSSDLLLSLAASPSAIFFSVQNGSTFQYSKATGEVIALKGVTSAISMAYDPIGDKIYWANPKKQALLRRSITSSDQRISDSHATEYLPVLTTALEIGLDSARALLFWTTGHSVEVARLNGRNQQTLTSVGLFSGVRILSISVDVKSERIFWLSRTSTASVLYQKSYRSYYSAEVRGQRRTDDAEVVVGTFEEGAFKGPLRYLSERLLVLQSGSEALVQELRAPQMRAKISLNSIANISTLLVVGEQPHLNYSSAPPPVVPWSVGLTGKWDVFTITWQPVSHSKQVFYDISINGFNLESTSQPFVRIDNRRQNRTVALPLLEPYAELEISITTATFWSSSRTTVAKLRTPSGKPSAPRNPRFFLHPLPYPYTPFNNQSQVATGELRWDTPSEPNGVILGYLVHMWKGRQKVSESFPQVDLRRLSARVTNLSRNATYHFGIEAYTDGGVGRMSRKIQVEMQNGQILSKLMLTTGDKVEILDIDRNAVERLRTPYNPHTVAYYALEETLFCFDEGKHLFRSPLRGGNKTRMLSLSEGVGSNLVVNWISRKLFWIRESKDKKDHFAIDSLDLDRVDEGPKELFSSNSLIAALVTNPFTSSLVWTSVARNGIVSLHSALDDGTSHANFLKGTALQLQWSPFCGRTADFGCKRTERGPGRGLVFTQPSSGLIWLADEDGCKCIPLLNSTGSGRPWRLAAEVNDLYWISTQGHSPDGLYAGHKLGQSGTTQLRTGVITEISSIGPNTQPFPERDCLIPVKLEVEEAVLLNRTAHMLTLRLPAPEIQNCSLDKVLLPTPLYSIYYARVDDNGLTPCTKTSLSQCNVLENATSPTSIQHLEPYTSYTLFFSVTTYYSKREGLAPLFSAPVVMATAPGAPLPPTLLEAVPRTPTSLTIRWAQPEKLNGRKIWYAVEWEEAGSKGAAPNQKWAAAEGAWSQNGSDLELNVTNLMPEKKYSVWVVAYSELGDEFSKSEVKVIGTLGSPSNVTLAGVTPHELTVSWTAPNSSHIIKHEFMYREGWSSTWNATGLHNSTCAGCVYNVTVGDLKPKTTYGFRVKTWYDGDPAESFQWPSPGQVELETLADKPGSPGIPIVRGLGRGRYEVSWTKSEDNGAQVELYSLEGRIQPPLNSSANNTHRIAQIPTQNGHRRKRDDREVAQMYVAADYVEGTGAIPPWILLYNGTECRWEVVGLDSTVEVEFRVRSRNAYGWSEYSRSSEIQSLDELMLLVAEPQNFGVVVGFVLFGTLAILAFASLFTYVFRKQRKEKSAMEGSPTSSQRREVELATLRELPGGVHQNNILYAADFLLEFDSEDLEMHKVKRSQITLLKHLGSGAFGDVYEGYAINLRPTNSPPSLGSRVAIKTLRKSASGKEKLQFVEEARLMAQFRHPHILELLGICLDADPCLILELMSGGDLLSHLRSTRAPPRQSHQRATISLSELLDMAVQVAHGCVYLEEKHFVHRDLAARNCLVRLDAHVQRGIHRVVKIGDFGLARDVYRNDYYRKEGEGLLPVRWMAPESLVDGVFTTQSDVWSFGVLLWEIMTLGQQPYPARSNVEVLNYVRMGGRLGEPTNSPPPLTWLMFRCWEFEPQNRPTFKECLQHLLTLAQTHSENDQSEHTSSDNVAPSYQNTMGIRDIEGHPDFEVDLEGQDCAVFGQNGQEAESLQNELYATQETTFPKYLEVVGCWTPPPATTPLPLQVNDGYEIPLKPLPLGLPSLPPYPPLAPRREYYDRRVGTERRNLLGSTTSEDSADLRWRPELDSAQFRTDPGNFRSELDPGHFRTEVDMEESTNEEYEDECSSYGRLEGMHWRRPLRAID